MSSNVCLEQCLILLPLASARLHSMQKLPWGTLWRLKRWHLGLLQPHQHLPAGLANLCRLLPLAGSCLFEDSVCGPCPPELQRASEPAKSLQSCLTLHDPMHSSWPGSSVHGLLQTRNTGVGCHALLQGIFLNQGSNPRLSHLLHWREDSLPLVPPGKLQHSPRLLPWLGLCLVPPS